MTNYKKIQSISLEEMSKMLKEFEENGVFLTCSNLFCEKCIVKDCDDTCKYDDLEIYKWWLEQECKL